MNKRIKYTKGPAGAVRIVEDFLPPPSELVVKEDVEKVTIALSRRSVNFFKDVAKDKLLGGNLLRLIGRTGGTAGRVGGDPVSVR